MAFDGLLARPKISPNYQFKALSVYQLMESGWQGGRWEVGVALTVYVQLCKASFIMYPTVL